MARIMTIAEPLTTYQEWKEHFLADIDELPHNVAKGDTFVHKVLQIYYNLSEEDAIDATECAGTGDKGVDAVHIIPAEEEDSPRALVIQGKYGSVRTNLQVYPEAKKFLFALKEAYQGNPATPAVAKIAGILKNGGSVQYVIATVQPLSRSQQEQLADIKKLAATDFADKLMVEAINLDNIYAVLTTELRPKMVDLPCNVVAVTEDTYVGVARLTDMYGMLLNYARQDSGTIDSIYDHNIRKYLKRKPGSVNDGIYKTLETTPSRFIAYNNGITMICRAVQTGQAGLHLDSPYIVNGCQTTRTLYDFMNIKFPGIEPFSESSQTMDAYKDAFLAIKVLVVKDMNGYANNITRYSNRQNAIRGKDFIALDELYKQLKVELKARGYFFETQAGEYDMLPKHIKTNYPKATHVITSFDATLFYAAGVLSKPYTAFGRSGDFMPGGREFEEVIKDLQADDVFVPWMIAQHARELGYTALAQRNPLPGTAHRGQTRYLFLFLFFRLMQNVMGKGAMKDKIYSFLKTLKIDYDHNPHPQHPFSQLLAITDEAVATFMTLAESQQWYKDRSSFLKSKEVIQEDHLIMATVAATLKLDVIMEKIKQTMGKRKESISPKRNKQN